MKNTNEFTMIKMPDGKIVNKKNSEMNPKTDSEENKIDIPPIH